MRYNQLNKEDKIVKQLDIGKRNALRAKVLAGVFYKDFYNEEKQELLFNVPNNRGLSSAWEYTGLMSMTDKLAKLDKTIIPLMDKVIDGLEFYGFVKESNLWGYVVKRGDKPLGATNPGLAYDDNIWLTINFLRAYEVTGNTAYLSKAEFLIRFIIDEAWFKPLGGIFWDSRKEARHSCSNNPAIKPLVDLYKHTKNEFYLDWAKKVYNFSITLKDPVLNVYHDLVGARQNESGQWIEGIPGGGYYSYNTGAMISGAAALYGVTGEKKYLDEALSASKGAFDYFGNKNIVEGYVGFPVSTTIWFNTILLTGYLELYLYAKKEAITYIEAYQKSMDYAYNNFLKDGYMPIDWLLGWQDNDKNNFKEALDHSSNIEMYALLAIFEKDLR
jgi:hypothetical protein